MTCFAVTIVLRLDITTPSPSDPALPFQTLIFTVGFVYVPGDIGDFEHPLVPDMIPIPITIPAIKQGTQCPLGSVSVTGLL